ncbi:MAG TPA: hypothetical protein PLS53_00015 [Thermoanaerobaculaceae bacterium]|nr:hypothetical protein [Thermoanaerobaculaceae bacterium]
MMFYSMHREPLRPVPTWAQRLNPFWWLSDTERNMAWPWLKWFLRNPATNFFSVIMGVAHRARTVHTLKPGEYTLAPQGFNIGITVVQKPWWAQVLWPLVYPFLSYRGEKWEWVTGWKTSGTFSLITFRRANAPNAAPLP